jgi:hypothetical protein
MSLPESLKGSHMKNVNHAAMVLGLTALILQSCATSQTPHQGSCGKTPKLELESLTMFPDPLPEARKIDQWRAIIRSDSSAICHATLAVVAIVEDGKTEPITLEKQAELSLGANNIVLYTIDSHRLSGKEVCFEMTAHINGNKAPIEAPRRACARTIDRGWWSMR